MRPTLVRALFVLVGLLMVGAMVWPQTLPKPEPADYPSGFRTPILALELPADRIELGLALDAGRGNRDLWRRLTRADMFFPPLYATFFSLMAFALASRAGPGARAWAWAAAAMFFAGALADYFENVAILTALDIPARYLSNEDAFEIRAPALIKWSLLSAGFVVVALLALRGTGARRWIAAPALFMGIGLLGWWRPVLVEWGSAGMLLAAASAWIGEIAALARGRA